MIVLPPEYLEDSLNSYIYKHTTHSQIIYWVVLVALAACLIALPLIYVDVTVQNAGMIRPVNERTEIKVPISEMIDSIYVKEGSKVKKGDILLQLRSDNLQSKNTHLQQQLYDINAQINDLKALISNNVPSAFSSGLRQQQYVYYAKRKQELETLLEKAEKEHERNKLLYEKEVISANEYEQYFYAYQKLENELSSLQNNQLSTWQTDLNALELSRMELRSTANQLQKEKEFYYVTAPIAGTVEQFNGIYRGNILTAGQTVAVISPDSTLFVEVYVSPRNIGYIRKGMSAHIQIESFDYNQWGTIWANVTDISSDFYFDTATNSSQW